MPVEPHERFTPEETYQRRVDTMEWKPAAMTEEKRLEWRRFEAGHAFEMMPRNRNLSGEQFKEH